MRAAIVAMLVSLCSPALARDLGQWEEGASDEVRAWFPRQMQPDHPMISCCGPADAYHADRIEVDAEGRFFAIITDERDDGPLGRPHRDVGSRVEIPPHKFNDPRRDPNPTGHGIVFLSSGGNVFCYFNPPGDG